MLEQPMYGAQRAILFRLLIDSVRGFSGVYFGTDRPGENITDILVAATLMVGQGENRPMTADDAAEVSGLPRATVRRRLLVMMASGLVVMEMRGRRKVYGLADVNRETALVQLQRLFGQYQRVLEQLAKMNGQNDQKSGGT
jgi:predicted transcriptional regulator